MPTVLEGLLVPTVLPMPCGATPTAGCSGMPMAPPRENGEQGILVYFAGSSSMMRSICQMVSGR